LAVAGCVATAGCGRGGAIAARTDKIGHERNVMPNRAGRAQGRGRHAIHQELDSPGIAGAQHQPRLVRRRPGLAGPQHARQQHTALAVAHLHPGFSLGAQHDLVERSGGLG
jgi:hypothetical protein